MSWEGRIFRGHQTVRQILRLLRWHPRGEAVSRWAGVRPLLQEEGALWPLLQRGLRRQTRPPWVFNSIFIFFPFSFSSHIQFYPHNVTHSFPLLQSPRRAPATCVPAWTGSTPTPTPACATSSTHAWTDRPRSTPAPQDSGSMSTLASATGPRPPTGRSARLRLTVSSKESSSWCSELELLTKFYKPSECLGIDSLNNTVVLDSSGDLRRVPVPLQRPHWRVRPVRPPPQVRRPQRLRQVLRLPERHLSPRAGLRARPRLQRADQAVRRSRECTWVVSDHSCSHTREQISNFLHITAKTTTPSLMRTSMTPRGGSKEWRNGEVWKDPNLVKCWSLMRS